VKVFTVKYAKENLFDRINRIYRIELQDLEKA